MEGDAGTRQLNPTDAQDTPDDSVAVSDQEQTTQEHHDSADEPTQDAEPSEGVEELGVTDEGVDRRPPRLGRGWVAGICAGLVALTVAAIVGGILLIRDNRGIQEIS